MTETTGAAASNICFVVGIMLTMGVLGGTINYFMKGQDPADTPSSFAQWFKAVLIGCGAALLIPLFLNTISSNLLSEALRENGLGLQGLIFASFCLLAAISSRAFIETLADRILKEAREAKQKAEAATQTGEDAKQEAVQARAEIDAITEAVVEPGAAPEAPPPAPAELGLESMRAPAAQATPARPAAEELRVLEALDDSKYTMRSTWGMSQDLQKSPEATKSELQQLAAKGWVSRVEGKKGPRWVLTAAGRRAIKRQT